MRLAVWPGAPAAALADALAAAGVVTATALVEPHEARAALDDDLADLVLMTTLDVLRAPDGLAVVPGVVLAGERSPRRVLAVAAPLDRIGTVAFDPRDQQEALLVQLVLREHYAGRPAFRPVGPGATLGEALSGADAAVVAADALAGLPDDGYVLDPGQEFTDLTLRPMPWGLVVARAGTLAPAAAAALADAARRADPDDARLHVDGEPAFQLTLDGYAADGLDQLVELWFETGTLDDIVDVPFAPTVAPAPPTGDGDPDDEDL